MSFSGSHRLWESFQRRWHIVCDSNLQLSAKVDVPDGLYRKGISLTKGQADIVHLQTEKKICRQQHP